MNKDAVVLVTGSDGQLGKAIIKKLNDNGITKIIHLDVINCNVSDIDEVERQISYGFNRYGRIDVIINNAGITNIKDFTERTQEDFSQVLDVNLKGPFNVIQKYVEYFEKFKMSKGNIINIGSIYGLVSPDFRIYDKGDRKSPEVYGATKAGLIQMTKYFACYLADKNIRVNCVSPGGVYNQYKPQSDNFIKKYTDRVPMKRMAKDSEIADGVFYLASDMSSYVNGHNLVIDGGLTAW